MLRQELLYTTRDPCLPIRPAAVWTGTVEAVPTSRRSRCPTTVASNRQLSNLFFLSDEKSCLIFGPNTPTTNPYNLSATPDVLDIVITQKLTFPVYLTSCSALNLDHLLVIIDSACRSSFQHPPDRPDFRSTDWANFETHLEDQIKFDPELYNGGWQWTSALRTAPPSF
jgi:hypothetical protein